MGTFEGHLLPGAAFVLWGVWHMVNVVVTYVRQPTSFHTRAWWPFPFVSPSNKFRYIELALVIFGSCVSISSELVIAQPGHWMLDKDGNIPVHMMAQFEHASMSLYFLLYALVALTTEGCFSSKLRPLPFGFLHVLLGAALGQEYLLFLFHSGDHMGVEGQYHTLLRIPIALALLSCLLETAYPRVFLLPLLRSAGMLLQGLLLIQTAFSVWVPSAVALHCGPTPEHSIWCEDETWTHRAKGLANLQFNWWCAAVVVFTVVLFVVLRSWLGKEDYLPLGEARGTDIEDWVGSVGGEASAKYEAAGDEEHGREGVHEALT